MLTLKVSSTEKVIFYSGNLYRVKQIGKALVKQLLVPVAPTMHEKMIDVRRSIISENDSNNKIQEEAWNGGDYRSVSNE